MTYSLSQLAIYPIKSVKGISLKSSQVTKSGLLGDRRYMVVTPDGDFITGREHPTLTLIEATQLEGNSWRLSHPNMNTELTLNQVDFSNDYKDIVIWEEHLQGQVAKPEVNSWFSSILDKTVELVFFGDKSKRFTSRKPDTPVAFADGYPFLLTTQASLDELNESCPEDIKMAQFRPNLVIEGNKAFEEDNWKRIKIGEVEFENVKPCERCIFITLNPETAERLKKGEPLKALGKFRTQKGQGIHFGINLVALNSGVINLNDKVEILEYQEFEPYRDRR